MLKRRRGSDSDSTTTRTMGYNTVFVDTNLDTSVAMLVSDSDTVSDFKKKLASEHKQCYPEMELRVHSLKVKHKSRFYRLSDTMLVWSAFHGVKRRWYLSVDASNTNSSELGLVVSMKTMENNCGALSSDVNRTPTLPMPSPGCSAEKNNELLDIVPYIGFGNSLDNKTDVQDCKETGSPAKKKRKMRHTRDVCHDLGSKESDPQSHVSSKETVIHDTLVCGISTADAVKKGIGAEVSVLRNDGSVLEERVASEGNLRSTVDCQNPTGSDERKNDTVLESTPIPENLMASHNEYEPGLDIRADHPGVVYVKVPDRSTGSTLNKRKRKKAQETVVNIQYATDVEQTLKGKSTKPCPDIHKSEEKEEEKHLSLGRDHEVEMPSSYKADLTHKEASSKIMIPSKKKKKKKIEKNLEMSGTEKTDHDFSVGPPGLVTHHIPIQTDKEESTMDCKKSIASDERKNDTILEGIIIPENLSASKELEPGLDIRADNFGADSVKVPDISAGLMDDSGTIENINSTCIKRKRKKTQETAVNIQNATEVEQTPKGDIHKSEGKEEEKHLSINSDHEVDIQSSNKASDHTNSGLKHKEESKIMIPSKKKKIKKKSANTNLEKSGTEQTDNDISGGPSGLLCLSTRHLPLETGKEENILLPGGEDVQLKLMNGGNEVDFVMSSQTKQTLEAVSSGKRETDKETQNSPSNGLADIPVVEKENQIVEFHQLEKDTENTVITSKSAKKKRKKKTLTTSDVQEDLPVKNQNVGIGSSTEEYIHVDSSQVISRKSKEKLEQEQEIAVYSNDQARTNEENILLPGGEDVQLKLMNGGNEADFVMSSQTKQTLEAVSSGKRETDKETQNSPSNGLADIPVVEKENQIVEFHQLEKDTENTVITGKSAKKKRKKKTLTTSDVQEDLPVKNQNVGIGSSTEEYIHVDSSQVISRKSKEKLEQEHEIAVYSNDQARTNEENILLPGGEDVQLKLMNGGNEADFVMSSQNKQTLEAVSSGKRETDKETQNIVEFHQLEKDTENTVNTGKSAKKRRKRKTLTTSDVLEDLPVKNQNVGIGSSTEEYIHVESSQVISRKSKEKLEQEHEIAVYTNDQARTNEENILLPGGEDVQLKLMNGGNETDLVISSQTKQTLESVSSGKREMDKETQNSPSNGLADIPVVEKENQIVEFHQLEKDTENTVITCKSAKKKRKKKTLTTSDVQEDLSVKNHNVGIGSSTEEYSIKNVNSGVDGIHVDSSQGISPKSKEKLEQEQEIAVYTNDQARTNESEGEGVNFKQYFVPDHYQDKSGSHGEAKKPNQSEVKTVKKLKKNGPSSVSISTEVQSSSKLSADGERNNKSCVRKDSGKREGDSAQNSDWDEVIPNSSRRSSRGPEKIVKDSNTSEIPGTLFKKPGVILAGSSLPQKKNASLKKSSLERIEKLPEKSGNKMPHFGVNVTNMMELKTPEKKSLLTKLGSLFEDNSGESSGDENGTAHSSDSTQSPSDSSSTSDHSVGESDLSLDSARNGSSDARVRSTGGKDTGTSKFDSLSARKDVTMMMILQSSDRFKRAKLLASQNEAYQNDTQPIEFVPDSQPS